MQCSFPSCPPPLTAPAPTSAKYSSLWGLWPLGWWLLPGCPGRREPRGVLAWAPLFSASPADGGLCSEPRSPSSEEPSRRDVRWLRPSPGEVCQVAPLPRAPVRSRAERGAAGVGGEEGAEAALTPASQPSLSAGPDRDRLPWEKLVSGSAPGPGPCPSWADGQGQPEGEKPEAAVLGAV